VCRHFVLNLLAFCFIVSGISTIAWYTFEGAATQSNIAGDAVYRVQQWAVAYNGIEVNMWWCYEKDEPLEDCVPDVEQFRYFNNADNHKNLLFTGKYVELSATADTGGKYLLGVTIPILLYFVVALFVDIAAYMKPPPRNYMLLLFLCHVTFSALAVILPVQFFVACSGIIQEMKTNSFILNTAPAMSMGFSFMLYFFGAVFGLLGNHPGYYITPGVDGVMLMQQEINAIRKERKEQYQGDLNATSYVLEKVPLDSKTNMTAGWTTDIVTAKNNPLQGRELTQADLEEAAKPSFMSRIFGSNKTAPMPDEDHATRPQSAVSDASSKYAVLPEPLSPASPAGSRPSSAIEPASPLEVSSPVGSPGPSSPNSRPGTAVSARSRPGTALSGNRPSTAKSKKGAESLASPSRPQSPLPTGAPGSPMSPGSPGSQLGGEREEYAPTFQAPRFGETPLKRLAGGRPTTALDRSTSPSTAHRPTTAGPRVNTKSLVERATDKRESNPFLTDKQREVHRLKGLAKGMRPMSAMPGGMWAAQFGLPDETLTPRSMGVPLELGDPRGPFHGSPSGRLPPLPGEEEKKPKVIVDRSTPCPEAWASQPDKHDRPSVPPGCRPSSPVTMRTRAVTKAPQSDGRLVRMKLPKFVEKEGTIKNPYDPPYKLTN